MKSIVSLALVASASADVLWDGRLNDLSSASDLDEWSWSNQVGPYQWYIHGSGATTEYVDFSSDYKNPADSGSDQGMKLTLTDTAYWNGQNMRRTELIPQTSAAINSGSVFYHFSIKREDDNAPATTREHQIAFFESHFTELKSGWISGESGTENPALQWMVGGVSKWSVEWEAGVWHNVAYEIDFSANTVGFWHSTGSDPLEQTVAPLSASTSSNGADWHVGVLELPRDGYSDETEDFYFSGVYVEDGEVTTSVSGPSGGNGNDGGSDSTSNSGPSSTSNDTPPTTTLVTSTRTDEPPSSEVPPVTTLSSSAGSGASRYEQCGGSGWSGPTACAPGLACSTVNPYYFQCL